jgi:hypothetical protein
VKRQLINKKGGTWSPFLFYMHIAFEVLKTHLRRCIMSVANILVAQTNRVVLSSAFSNRMLTDPKALSIKIDITMEDAKALVSLAERADNIAFENAINPRHESTCALAQGLTKSEPTGAMVSLNDGDVVVVMQPSAASRNDTEFDLKHFEECSFQAVQQIPLSMLQKK